MTDPDLDKVVETIKRNSDEGMVRVSWEDSRVGGILRPKSVSEKSHTEPRDTVTMNKPLEVWGAPDSFHRTLALHIDTVTFAACGKGLLDEDNLSPWVWYPLCALLLLMFGLIVWRFA